MIIEDIEQHDGDIAAENGTTLKRRNVSVQLEVSRATEFVEFYRLSSNTHTCSFIKKLSDATQHKVIDKIQSLCTKVNVNNKVIYR